MIDSPAVTELAVNFSQPELESALLLASHDVRCFGNNVRAFRLRGDLQMAAYWLKLERSACERRAQLVAAINAKETA